MRFTVLVLGVGLGIISEASAANPNSFIAIQPADPIRITNTVGEPYPNQKATFVITNSGRGLARWSVGIDVDWAEIRPSCGVLLPRSHAELTVQLKDLSMFKSGVMESMIGFTNHSGTQPRQLRSLAVHLVPTSAARLSAPILNEPPFTKGPSNTVSWLRVPGANEYRVQMSATSDFMNAIETGWIRETNHVFHGMSDGTRYFYRVQCRSNSLAWSQTLPHQFATNNNSNVSYRTQPGDIVLAGNTNRFWFEDFESPGTSWTNTLFSDLSLGFPDSNWEKTPLGPEAHAPDSEPQLPINQRGDNEGRLFGVGAYSRQALMATRPENLSKDATIDAFLGLAPVSPYYSVSAGLIVRGNPAFRIGFLGGDGYAAYIQADSSDERLLSIYSLDQGILYSLVPFPANRFPAEAPDENYHMRFSAQGSKLTLSLWRVVARDGIIIESPVRLGNGTNVQVVHHFGNTEGVVGLNGLAWDANNTSGAFYDDVTILADDGPAHYELSGTSVVSVTPPPWFESWGSLNFTDASTSSSTLLSVDVLDGNGNVLATDLPSGSDLARIPKVVRLRTLQLRANFSTTNPAFTPALSDWTVRYRSTDPNASESSWSTLTSSVQDSSPPMVRITNPATNRITVTNASFALTGTASDDFSGISRVRVLLLSGTNFRSLNTDTTNGFGNWNAVLPLFVGANTIRVLALDNAEPPNTAVVTTTISYSPQAGQLAVVPASSTANPSEPILRILDSSVLEPTISAEVIDGLVFITWPVDFHDWKLEATANLLPPDWIEVGTAGLGIAIVPLTGRAGFFRLTPR